MPRYQRSHWRHFVALTILAVLLVARLSGWIAEPAARTPADATPGLSAGVYEIERVIDGDTLVLRNHDRVRLQGVDAPEIAHEDHPEVDPFGPEATTFTQVFIRDAGGRVRLEFDGERRDHYERWLAFIWHDDRMLNEELVRAGLAHAKLGYDYSQAKKDRLRRRARRPSRRPRSVV